MPLIRLTASFVGEQSRANHRSRKLECARASARRPECARGLEAGLPYEADAHGVIGLSRSSATTKRIGEVANLPSGYCLETSLARCDLLALFVRPQRREGGVRHSVCSDVDQVIGGETGEL